MNKIDVIPEFIMIDMFNNVVEVDKMDRIDNFQIILMTKLSRLSFDMNLKTLIRLTK